MKCVQEVCSVTLTEERWMLDYWLEFYFARKFKKCYQEEVIDVTKIKSRLLKQSAQKQRAKHEKPSVYCGPFSAVTFWKHYPFILFLHFFVYTNVSENTPIYSLFEWEQNRFYFTVTQ